MNDEKKNKVTKKNTNSNETIKNTAKKTTIKKAKKVETKNDLNETINLKKDALNEIKIAKDENLIECKYCHKNYEKGYTICPHCHKRQKTTSIGIAFFITFAIIFLIGIITFHFIEKYLTNPQPEIDYKLTCQLVDYENLVRHPKDYKNKDIKVIGQVVNVEGYDDGISNNMTITINVNLFENGINQLITIEYNDYKYEQGFLAGDLITVYGKYTSINGNIPNISAEYIVFGK